MLLAVLYRIQYKIPYPILNYTEFFSIILENSIDSGESYRYEYDLNNNVTKSIQKNQYRTLETEYTYDKDSRETSTRTMSKTYSTAYDALGRITSQTWNTTTLYAVQYTYQAGTNGSQSSQVQKVTSGGMETSYTYDANGNITGIVRGDVTIAYAYDELNQLIREDNNELNQTIAYVYDLGGNIKEKRIYSYQPNTATEALSQASPSDTIVYGYDSTWKDKMVSYDGQNITYDAIGNPLSYMGMTFTWEKARELGSITKDGTEYRYRYNRSGMRNRKFLTDGIVYYQIDGDLIVGEYKQNHSYEKTYELEYMYDSAGNILSVVYNGCEYYYVKNLQGDIVGIIDESGTQVVTYTYDSWGKVTEVGGSNQTLGNLNPFRYRGYYYDAETGFYYLNSRYYDPEVGRFLNADGEISGIGGELLGYNMFTYCQNNPVNMSDSDGNWPKWVKNVLVGAAVIAAAAVVTVATAGAATGVMVAVHCFAVGALKGAIIGGAIGAAVGAATSVVKNRVSTGSWKGSAKAARDGAAAGFKSGAITGAITGGMNSNVCFVAGTVVLTSMGYVAIEDIIAGDEVWSEDPETGKKELKEVVQTFVNETDEVVHVYVNGEEIITTSEHPFYVPKKGWVGAIHLRAGDILVLQNGKYVMVELVQHEILESPITVYNFEVEEFHTYYVSESAVLVHNVCGPKNQVTYSTRKQAFNAAKRDIGVPKSQQPIVKLNIGNRGELNPGRLYDFGNGKFIRDDIAGHVFPDGASMGRHFNTSTGLHIFY